MLYETTEMKITKKTDTELSTETDRVLAQSFSPAAANDRLVNSAELTTSSVQVCFELPVNTRTKLTRCHAIAGSTARCGCKFRYVSKFSVALADTEFCGLGN